MPTDPADQDARLRFQPGPADPAWRPALVAALRDRVGWPPLGPCQDETLQVLTVQVQGDGLRLTACYTFDHDFASQYDRTESLQAELWLDATGRVLHARWSRLEQT